MFATPALRAFLFRRSRSAGVAREALGEKPLAGVLVVNRYNAYNRAPCQLQYCYAHLLRGVEDLAQEFPDQAEVQAFTATLIPLLAAAMHLHLQPFSISLPSPKLRDYRDTKILLDRLDCARLNGRS